MNLLPAEVLHCVLNVLEPAPRPLRLASVCKRFAVVCASWRPKTLPFGDIPWTVPRAALLERSKVTELHLSVPLVWIMSPNAFPGLHRLVICSAVIVDWRGQRREEMPADVVERMLQHVATIAPVLQVVCLQLKQTGSSAFSALDAFRAPFSPPFEVIRAEEENDSRNSHEQYMDLGKTLLARGFHGCTPVSVRQTLLDFAIMYSSARQVRRLISEGAHAWPAPIVLRTPHLQPLLAADPSKPAGGIAGRPAPPPDTRLTNSTPLSPGVPCLFTSAIERTSPSAILRVLASEPHYPYNLSPAEVITLLAHRSHTGYHGWGPRRSRSELAVANIFAPLISAALWTRTFQTVPQHGISFARAAPLRVWLELANKTLDMTNNVDTHFINFLMWAMRMTRTSAFERTLESIVRHMLSLLPPLTAEQRKTCVMVLNSNSNRDGPGAAIYALFLPISPPPSLGWAFYTEPLVTKHSTLTFLSEHLDLPLSPFLAFLRTTTTPGMRATAVVKGLVARHGKAAIMNFTDQNGLTLLHIGCEKLMVAMVLHLLDIGADTNVQDRYGRTPMHWLAVRSSSGTLDTAQNKSLVFVLHQLVRAGAQVHSEDGRRATAKGLATGALLNALKAYG